MNGRIAARFVSTAALGSTLVAASSCVRETPGHCAFVDGDSTCEAAYEGTFCIFQGPGFLEHAAMEYRNVSEAQRLGCYESRPTTSAGEDMGMELYACVPNGLLDGDDRIRDLRALKKGKKDGKPYNLVTFLDDYGVTPQVHEAGCQAGSGTTTAEASDSDSTTFGSESSTTDGVSSESSTTGPISCMGNEDCIEIEAPQCVDEQCMACVEGADGDAACAEVDATKPLCADGMCVQCTAAAPEACTGDTPVCDDATNTCVPCTEHEQCASGACELALGQCFPDGTEVLHVDGDGGADFMNVTSAVGAIPNGARGIIVVHEQGAMGETPYLGSASISGGKIIAMLAAPSESPVIQGTGGAPGLRVSGAGTILYVDGLDVSNNATGRGMRVDSGAFAWLDRSRIVQNSGGGILVESGSELTLRNCFVGGAVSDVDAIEVNASTLVGLYTTIGGGPVLGGRARALYCEGATSADVRNSILVSADTMSEVECPGAVLTNSATEDDVGMLNIMWFMSYATGNFSLTASGATTFADIAQWQTGDPATDIDGTPRPAMDGTPDYAGADVP